ncbi:hypothetical protein [Streptomyces sp. NPDC002328]|uniref:hypothetical protein n=1 Tax=Streptomyces sp. NPDC002328 TaxID=3364642 RepID=UPI0036929378
MSLPVVTSGWCRLSGLAKVRTPPCRRGRPLAPHARVYVGYPAILPADGAGCGGVLPFAPGDMSYLREKEQQFNSELRERAHASGVYVDTYGPSEGRDAYSAATTHWIESLAPSSPAAAPTPTRFRKTLPMRLLTGRSVMTSVLAMVAFALCRRRSTSIS